MLKWPPWCDICNREIKGSPGMHAATCHMGEGTQPNRHSIDELNIALEGCRVDQVTPLLEGEGGICILHVTTPEGNTKRVFLRRSIGFWFTEAAS